MRTRSIPGLIVLCCITLAGSGTAVQARDGDVVKLDNIGAPPASILTELAKTGMRFKKNFIRPKTTPFPDENPYTIAKYRLGKALFFDPRLSRSGVQSCASCHNPGFSWSDGLPVAVGDHMEPLTRRTPSIVNVAWGEVFTWDGRINSLENQVLEPISGNKEMNLPLETLIKRLSGIEEYRRMFAAAFGPNSIKAENVAKAIATFERMIISEIAPFDRWIEGDENAISDRAKKGFVLFNTTARCVQCHSTWLFTDDSFHDTGLPSRDLGRGKFFPEEPKMQYAFKTPGLRNVSRRGPYMHDGSLKDLAAVVKHYNDGGIKRHSRADDVLPLYLTEEEQHQLVAFMMTLTSKDRLVSLPILPH